MADSKRPQNNTIEFLTKLTKLFQSGPRIRHKIPKDITGKRTPEVMNALHSGQYLSNRDPYIYNQADRFYRYEDFAIMEFTPIIAAALDVYASAVASLDENRRSIIVRSKNPKIKAILYSLFMDIMNLNVNLYPWARNLVKYGDFFSYLRIDPNHGIIGVDPIPMDGIERVEKLDPKTGEKEVVFKVNLDGVGELKAHQVAHFRLPFNDQFFPYGTCLAWDTKVDTEHGKKQICDITTDDLVWCFDRETQTRKLSRVLDTVHSGAKECFRFVTEHGYYVDASLEHRIMVQDAGGFTYKPADEIAVGDLFVVESDTGFKTVSVIFIEPVGKQEVYDIHVEDDNHNFYANGIVVHNSILDPARKIWRMLCMRNNSTIWTSNGYKEIQNLQIGDEVYAYTNGVPITTKVKNVWSTGKKNSWEVSTQLNTLVTSAEHRFLVVDSEGKESYVCASELNSSIHRLVCPVLNDDTLADRRNQIYKTFQGANVAFFPTKSESLEFLALCQKSGIPGYKINDTCIGILRSVPVYDDVHYEEIVSVVSLDQESEMYDIEVEHEVHNFVANGIVTHNCLLEDAMMVYRIVRAPERRIFKIDVGNIPPESVEAFMEEQQNRMRRQIVVDDSTGRLDLRYSALPVWSKSPIPLLDGRTITIEQLANEYDAGNENWVYSVQDETQEVVPGKVVWCGKNYTAERLIKVWLDDNTWIMTAPEHPFVLRDGSNKRADELNVGDALMPFYQKISGEKDIIHGYAQVYVPAKDSYKYVHRVVAESALAEEKKLVGATTDWTKNNYLTVHHKDIKKRNNNPTNLQWMGNDDHTQWHIQSGANFAVLNHDPEFQAKRKAGNARYLNEEGGREAFLKVAAEYNNSDLHASHNPIRAKAMTEHWADDKKAEKTKKKMRIQFTQECFEELVRVFCAVDGKTNADGMCAALSNDTAFMAALQSANAENNRTESKALHRHNVIEWIREYSNYTDFRPFRDACLLTKKGFSFDEVMRDYTDIIELDRDSLYQKAKALGVPGYSGLIKDKQRLLHATVSHVAMIRPAMIQNDSAFTEVVGYKNHKVLRIEEIVGSEDVYCMTVVGPNGEDDRHNFAVCGMPQHEDAFENVDWSKSLSGCFVRNSLESDYFVPVRGNVGTEIDTLQGGTWSDGIQDIEYLQANLFAALRVPKPYLNFMDSADASKTALTEMSMIFSDHVRRIQCAILDELTKVAMIHLMFFGFDQEDMMDFELDLASSSRLAQQQTMEIYRQKFEILSGAPEDIPRRLLYKKIMGWDDDDIEEMTKDKIREAKLMGILKKLSDGDFEGAAGGMGGFGGGFDSGGGGDDFDLGGGDDLGGDTGDLGGDDLGGSEDIGGDTGGGIEPTGGSGGAESEVEDLFQGPFDPKGQSVFRTPDDVEEFERRRNQAQDILRQAIAISPMDFLIHGNPEDEEDAPKKDRHGRTKGEPVARRTQDRERAPGAGRPIEPGHSPRITGKDRNGSGRRHVAVATGNNSTSTRYHNDLIKPDRDSFKVAQENRAGLSKEYKDALNSLSKSFGRAALLEANTGVDDLDAALSSWSEAQKGQETAKKDGEMKKGAGIPPKKSLSPSELRQQRALADQDKAVKDALTKVQKAVVDKDKEKAASTETTEEEPETTTVNTKLTITSNEG